MAIKRLGSLGLSLLLLGGCQTAQSPTGRTQMLMFSEQQMSELGDQSFSQILEKEQGVDDPRTLRYVQCVTDAITAVIPADYPRTRWRVEVFESPQVNAFALPGGNIGVYTGLLKVAHNQDQLAAVIGHEVGHVLARHSNERLSRSQMTDLGLQAAGVLLDISGIGGRSVVMPALGLGAQVGVLLPFDRRQETESDQIGIDLMARAGFDPAQSVSLWQRMDQASKGPEPLELLSTHPSHDRRIAELQARVPAATLLYRQAQQEGRRPQCSQ